MRTWLRYILRMRLATKQFIFLVISSSILFAAGGWYVLDNAERQLKSQLDENAQVVLARTDEYLDVYLDNIKGVLLTMSADEELFYPGKDEEVIEVLRSYASNHVDLRTLYVLRQDGEVLSNQQVYLDVLGNPRLEQLLELSVLNNGGMNWTAPYRSPVSQRTMAFVVPVYEHNRFLGALAVEIDLYQLRTRLSNLMESDNQSFTVLTMAGDLIATGFNRELLPMELGSQYMLETGFREALVQLPNGTETLSVDSGEWVTAKSSRNALGWQLIALIDKEHYFRSVSFLYQSTVSGAILWVIFLLASALLIARSFSKPILTLVQKMNRVQSLEVFSRIETNREDEIGELSRSYNDMMLRIQELTRALKESEETKRVYELNLLQSQIGPHFLYNTLTCISSLAIQNRNREVHRTIQSLVGLLSYSISKNDTMVPLKEELAALQQYVEIQKVRYGAKFNLELHADEEANSYLIPKLTLQPLVENSIFHGFASVKDKGRICIKVTLDRASNRIKLYIADNGIGMDRETLSSLWETRKVANRTQRKNHIGLTNVRERLSLYFGQRSSMTIRSRFRTGTVIRIVLPIIHPKDEGSS